MTISTPREALEAAAKVADEYPLRDPGEDGNGYWAAEEIAAAILDIPVAEPELLLPTGTTLLEKAAKQFRFYEEQHRAKGTPEAYEKSKVNGAMAHEIECYLSLATPDPLTAKLVEALQNIRALAQKRQNERGFEGGVLEDIAGFARAALAAAEERG